MEPQPLKHCKCEQDQGVGVLLVDVESETIPRKDAHGNQLYYCLKRQHVFSAKVGNPVVVEEVQREVSGVV